MKVLFRKDGRKHFAVLKTVLGILFGLVSGYLIFAITYHQLGKMDNLAIVENGGVLVALFAIVGFIGKRKTKDLFYKNMLTKLIKVSLTITTSTSRILILSGHLLKMLMMIYMEIHGTGW